MFTSINNKSISYLIAIEARTECRKPSFPLTSIAKEPISYLLIIPLRIDAIVVEQIRYNLNNVTIKCVTTGKNVKLNKRKQQLMG